MRDVVVRLLLLLVMLFGWLVSGVLFMIRWCENEWWCDGDKRVWDTEGLTRMALTMSIAMSRSSGSE
jgi:hypothetical protein